MTDDFDPKPMPKLRQNSKDLTPERVVVLGELIRFQNEHSYPPSLRELARNLNLRSTATVHAHLESLERQGLVKRSSKGAFRNWRPTGGGRRLAA